LTLEGKPEHRQCQRWPRRNRATESRKEGGERAGGTATMKKKESDGRRKCIQGDKTMSNFGSRRGDEGGGVGVSPRRRKVAGGKAKKHTRKGKRRGSSNPRLWFGEQEDPKAKGGGKARKRPGSPRRHAKKIPGQQGRRNWSVTKVSARESNLEGRRRRKEGGGTAKRFSDREKRGGREQKAREPSQPGGGKKKR